MGNANFGVPLAANFYNPLSNDYTALPGGGVPNINFYSNSIPNANISFGANIAN